MQRDLMFAVIDMEAPDRLHLRGQVPFSVPTNDTCIIDIATVIVRALDLQVRLSEGKLPGGTFKTNTPALEPGKVRFFSWACDALSEMLPGCMVPRPGVVLVIIRSEDVAWPDAADFPMIAFKAKTILEMHDPNGKRQLREFMTGPAAHVAPISPAPVDVFLSHATTDKGIAAEFKQAIEMEQPGCRVFVAEMDLIAGSLWSEEIRGALTSSKCALLLLTPDSVASSWVMAEVGALWALNIPWIPAVQYVADAALPEFITERQTVDIRTNEGRHQCVQAIIALLRAT